MPENSRGPPTSSFEKRAYTINEVGALTGISRTTIYHAIKIKQLSAVKCGRRTLIGTQDLQAWIDAWPRERYRNRLVAQWTHDELRKLG